MEKHGTAFLLRLGSTTPYLVLVAHEAASIAGRMICCEDIPGLWGSRSGDKCDGTPDITIFDVDETRQKQAQNNWVLPVVIIGDYIMQDCWSSFLNGI